MMMANNNNITRTCVRNKTAIVRRQQHLRFVLLLALLSVTALDALSAQSFKIPSRGGSTTTTTTEPAALSQATTTTTTASSHLPSSIRIRTSQQSDLPAAAMFLSKAIVGAEHKGWTTNNFKAKIDQLWAQNDIEKLLVDRWHVIQEGKKSYQRLEQDLLVSHQDDDKYEKELQQFLLKQFWNRSDRFKTLLARASKATGEANLWQHHNFALTPPNRRWLHHLQMTALDVQTDQVVGFCEVAMLSNPLLKKKQQQQADDDDSTITNSSLMCSSSSFSPAITNLAVCPSHRRRGIASRLLQTAQRYAQQQWDCHEGLGLYVDQCNAPALALYKKLGYQVVAVAADCCDDADDKSNNADGDRWYMINHQRRRTNEKEVAKRRKAHGASSSSSSSQGAAALKF